MHRNKTLLILAIIALIIGLAVPIFYLIGALFLVWYFVSIWGWRKFFKRVSRLIGILIILLIIVLGYFAYKMWQGDQWGIDRRWGREVKEFPEQIDNFHLIEKLAINQLGQKQIEGNQLTYQDNGRIIIVRIFQVTDNFTSAKIIEDYKRELDREPIPRSTGIKYGTYSQPSKWRKEIKIGGRLINPATILEWQIPAMDSESAGLAWNHQNWVFVVSCSDVRIRDLFVKSFPY